MKAKIRSLFLYFARFEVVKKFFTRMKRNRGKANLPRKIKIKWGGIRFILYKWSINMQKRAKNLRINKFRLKENIGIFFY